MIPFIELTLIWMDKKQIPIEFGKSRQRDQEFESDILNLTNWIKHRIS